MAGHAGHADRPTGQGAEARRQQHAFTFAADDGAGNRATDGADAGTLGGIAGFLLAGVGIGGLAARQGQRNRCRQGNGVVVETLLSSTTLCLRLDCWWMTIY